MEEPLFITQETKIERVQSTPESQAAAAPAESVQAEQKKEESAQAAATTETSQETQKNEVKEDDLVKILNERGISLSKIDDIKMAFEEKASLHKKVEELDALTKKGIEFPNEKAKALYEFALKFPGNELAAAKNYLNLAELDLQNADPKRLQFEDFALKYPHIPRDEAKAIFDAQYQDAFGDGSELATDLVKKFKHDEATRAARQSIESAVKSFREAKSPESIPAGPAPEVLEAINRGIESGLKDLKPTVTLPEYKTKTGEVVPKGAFNVEMSPEEASSLKAIASNPEAFLRDLVNSHKTETGMNWSGYLNDVYQFKNREKVYADVYSQGIERGMAILLNQINNTGKEKKVEEGKEAPVQKSWATQLRETRTFTN